MINLKDGYQAKQKDFQVSKPRPKSNILDRMPQDKAGAVDAAGGGGGVEYREPVVVQAVAGVSEEKYNELVDEMKLLKAVLMKHEKRIRELEEFSGLNAKRQAEQEKLKAEAEPSINTISSSSDAKTDSVSRSEQQDQ